MTKQDDVDSDLEWRLITQFDRLTYSCGLKPGDRLVVVKPCIVRDANGFPSGLVYQSGDIAIVLPGTTSSSDVVWLRWEKNQKLFTWSDDEDVFNTFERLNINE